MSTVEANTPKEMAHARKTVTVYVPGFQYSYAFRERRWNGKKCFLQLFGRTGLKGKVLTGLLPFVTHEAEVDYTDDEQAQILRLPPPGAAPVLPKTLPPLRDYQLEALSAMRDQGRGIVELAAGGGKTEIAIAYTGDFFHRSASAGPVLYLAYGVSLIQQCHERFSRHFPDVGLVLRDKVNLAPVTVASVNSLYNQRRKLLEWLKSVRVLFLDECQLSTSNTWHLLSLLCNSAYHRFGLSATPFTGDPVRDLLLIGQTGSPIVELSASRLVDKGFTAKPEVTMISFSHEKFGGYGGYEAAISEGIVENRRRNAVIKNLVEETQDERVLILVSRTAHGKAFQEAIPEAVFVSGSTPAKKREEAFSSRIVIATSVADFGLDLDIDVLILAGGGRGKGSGHEPVRLIQRLGRGQRRHRGKAVVKVFDFLDWGDKYLTSHAKERKRAWEAEGFPPQIRGTV